MKTVIYKQNGVYCTTTEENYNARIQNARAAHKMDGFNSAEEIIEYYCKYFGSKPEDFVVLVDDDDEYEMLRIEQQGGII